MAMKNRLYHHLASLTLKILTAISLIMVVVPSGMAQGLNAELSFDENYNQLPAAVACTDHSTYFVKDQKYSYSFSTRCKLYNIDTTGSINWQVDVVPIGAEYTQVDQLLVAENESVVLSGYTRETCDILMNCTSFIQKYTSTGSLYWTNIYLDTFCQWQTLTGLSLTGGDQMMFNLTNTTGSHFIQLAENGATVEEFDLGPSQLDGFTRTTNNRLFGYKNDSVFAFSPTGATLLSKDFNSNLTGFSSRNDTLFVMLQDSLYQLDTNLNVLLGTDIPGYWNFKQLKVDSTGVQLASVTSTEFTIHTLDATLQPVSAVTVPVTTEQDYVFDYKDHLTIAEAFPLDEQHAIRYRDFSFEDAANVSVNRTDIGVVAVEFLDTLVEMVNAPNVVSIDLHVQVLVKNWGPTSLENCKVKFFSSDPLFCNLNYYHNDFAIPNLAPNDSIWVDLGWVGGVVKYFPGANAEVSITICPFTSNPNFVVDLNVSNDSWCETLYLGHVGVEEQLIRAPELYPNPSTGKFYIRHNKEEKLRCDVYDVYGTLVLQQTDANELDLTKVPAGMYVVYLRDANGLESVQKVIKH